MVLAHNQLATLRNRELLGATISQEGERFLSAQDTNSSHSSLLHFHVCVHCGSAFQREVFEGRALTSGIYLCPKCGLEGPLNVEIRETQESKPSEGE
jgi:predicted RNA-binding Zn-ribbon protein involved in translation (DUF1610 family)